MLVGGRGRDLILGGDGDDTIRGGGGDTLEGGAGFNTIDYSHLDTPLIYLHLSANLSAFQPRGDVISNFRGAIGTQFDDIIETGSVVGLTYRAYGGAGNDTLRGGTNADTLDGGQGDDELYGRGGNDLLIGSPGADMLHGGGGATIDYSASDAGVVVVLMSGVINFVSGGYAEGDRIVSVQNIVGSAFDDQIDTRDLSAAHHQGGSGNDTIVGSDLTLSGFGLEEVGADLLEGGTGDDFLSGLAGNDTLLGGAGSDILIGGDGADHLDGGAGDDLLEGGQGDTLSGGQGEDQFQFTSDTNDPSGSGAVWITDFDLSLDILSLRDNLALRETEFQAALAGTADGMDLALANGVIVHFVGLADDAATREALWSATRNEPGIIQGTQDGDVLSGFADVDDQILGLDGADSLYGLTGDDTLEGGRGDDVLDGGRGDDLILGGDGDDRLVSSAGDDTLDGGNGFDVVDYSNLVTDSFFFFGIDVVLVGHGWDGAYTGDGDFDRLIDIEHVIGTEIRDAICNCGPDPMYLEGGGGDDTIWTGGGNDTLSGGQGEDIFHFNSDSSVPLTPGTTLITDFDLSLDNLVLQRGFALRETEFQAALSGTADGLDLTITNGVIVHFAGFVDDAATRQGLWSATRNEPGIILGTPDDDALSGFADVDDRMVGLDGADSLSGLKGDDTLAGLEGNDTLDGGDGADVLGGGAGDNLLLGGAGDDVLNGRNERPLLIQDNITPQPVYGLGYGEIGNDTMTGGQGADLFIIGVAQDVITDFDLSEDHFDFRGTEAEFRAGLTSIDGTLVLDHATGVTIFEGLTFDQATEDALWAREMSPYIRDFDDNFYW